MDIVRDGHITIGDPLLDIDLRGLERAHIDGSTFLYATTGANGGVIAYEIAEDGSVATVSSTQHFGNGGTVGTTEFVSCVEIDGEVQIVYGGSSAPNLLGFVVKDDGSLGGRRKSVDLSTDSTDVTDVVSTTIGTTQTLIVADNATGKIRSYVLQDDTYVETGGAKSLEGAAQLTVADSGETTFVVAADSGGQAVVVYCVNANGSLSETDRFGAAEGLGIQNPNAIETINAHGETWVIVGASHSSSLSVMRLQPDGSLEVTDHAVDTLHTRFGDLQSLSVVSVADWVFVVAGGGDDGLSLFALLPDGALLHLETLEHSTGAGLENVSAVEAVATGSEIQIFATSGTSGGLTQFSVSTTDLGEVVTGGDQRNGIQLDGGRGDDLITATDTGNDTLNGGQGDDILVAGSGNADLYGGAGRDVFVLSYTSDDTRIMDFERGRDRIDLSSFPMLYDASALTVQSTSWGARITFRDVTFTVYSNDGTPLDAEDLFADSFEGANHVLVLPQPGLSYQGSGDDETVTGTRENDTINGGGGNDVIWGEGSDDDLDGGGGNDTLYGGSGLDTITGGAGDDELLGDGEADYLAGGAGNDALSGATGNDSLYGNDGDDTVWAGDGDDLLVGGDGADLLNGHAGNDTLNGNGWNDTLRGDDGNDSLIGDWGADSLIGGQGDDTILGGDGHDEVLGDVGNDLLFGDNGADTIGGFLGDDTMYGGDGNDEIWGNDGTDLSYGGNGNDTLGGGNDNDTLYGEAGNDLVWGGHQSDLQYGGDGDDTVGGFSGNDTLDGGAGDDEIWGNVGNDVGTGGAGDDTFGGYDGDDLFYGGDGDDVIGGGRGNDTLWGGSGADTFQFQGTVGNDVVHDFEQGLDVLHIMHADTDFDDIFMRQEGTAVIVFVPTGQIALSNTDLADMGYWDFQFG